MTDAWTNPAADPRTLAGQRPEARRPRPHAAQGGPALHPGQGHYVDDVQLPGMLHLAILRSPVAHARIVSIDTTRGAGAPEGQGRHHRRRPGGEGSGVDADAVQRRAGGAGHRQGALPGPGGRVRRRRGPLLGPRRARADRRRVRHPRPRSSTSARRSTPDAPVIRDDLEGKTDNHCFDWETGDAAATEAVFAQGRRRRHAGDRLPARAPGADGDVRLRSPTTTGSTGKLTLWTTSQAPHAHRTLYALVAGLPEHKIRVISPDIGGGFGNKVPIYPGYVCAIVGVARHSASRSSGWRTARENLMSTGFARDYIMRGEIAATKEGKILADPDQRARRPRRLQRHRRTGEVPGRLLRRLHRQLRPRGRATATMTAVYTNKAPGGVAYACSFRITEAVYLVERMVDCLAYELEMDPAELRLKNFIQPEQFPYTTKTGWVYDSGDYETDACALAMEMAGYDELRARAGREARPRRADGHRRRRSSPRPSAPGPRKDMDILGLGMADGCELRVHPTGKAVVRLSVQSQGQGHETTFAQIVAEEIGHPARGHRGGARRHRPDPVRSRAPTAAGRHRCRGPPPPSSPARCATRPRSSRRACSRSPSPTSSGRRAPSTSRATRPRR